LNLSVGSAGAVNFNTTQHLNSMTLNGPAALSSGGLAVLTNALTINAPSGTLNLNNGYLIVDYTPPASTPFGTIGGYLTAGYAGGNWTGTSGSIRSSTASSATSTAVGYAESATALGSTGGTWGGQSVDGSAVLVHTVRIGNANLDTTVNVIDFNLLALNYNQANKGWSGGDFNYDGTTNIQDFNLLATNYNQPSV
jgi:hypothetical protein